MELQSQFSRPSWIFQALLCRREHDIFFFYRWFMHFAYFDVVWQLHMMSHDQKMLIAELQLRTTCWISAKNRACLLKWADLFSKGWPISKGGRFEPLWLHSEGQEVWSEDQKRDWAQICESRVSGATSRMAPFWFDRAVAYKVEGFFRWEASWPPLLGPPKIRSATPKHPLPPYPCTPFTSITLNYVRAEF